MKNKFLLFLDFLLIVAIAYGCSTFPGKYGNSRIVDNPQKFNCPQSFDEFAFGLPTFEGLTEQEYIPIPAPWKKISHVPDINQLYRWDHIETISYLEGKTQLWILDTYATFYNNPSFFETEFIQVYEVETDKWSVVPTAIEGTSLRVSSLLTYRDEIVLGVLSSANPNDGPNRLVLARYDLKEARFKVMQESLLPQKDNDNRRQVFALSNETNGVWIIRENDSIYFFDINKQELMELASIKEIEIIKSAQLVNNNQIYFLTYSWSDNSQKQVYYFDIESLMMHAVDLPEKALSNSRGIYVDSDNVLWVGVFGNLQQNGDWTDFHPNINRFIRYSKRFDHFWTFYQPPIPVFESSDGKLWFVMEKLPDPPTLLSGIAWYDPNTNEGCWFTDAGSAIVEDKYQNVWIISNTELYRLNLNELDN